MGLLGYPCDMPVLSATVLLLPVAGYADIDAQMERVFRMQKLPSLAYAIVEDGKIRHQRVWGDANLETTAKANTETVYEIGSMSKQFTAAAILLLQEDGKLKLDDTLEQHLPKCPELWKSITIRQALSHTAGLKEYLATFSAIRTETLRSDDMIAKMATMPLDFEPGTAWSYSNLGYLVATLIVERHAGKKLDEFLKERIFTPLKMDNTSSSQPDKVIANRARGYTFTGKEYRNAPIINPSLASGAGYLLSTLGDIAKWEAALQQGKVFKQTESQTEFFKEVNFKSGQGSGYALGWFVGQDKGRPVIEHGGNTVGFSVNLFRLPKEKLAIVTLTNGGGFNPGTANRQALVSLEPSYNPSIRKETDPTPRQTAELALLLRRWARANYDESMFDPSYSSMLKTLRGTSLRQAFVGIGKSLKTVRYLDEETSGDQRRARYALELANATMVMEIGWTKADKIIDFDVLFVVPKTQ